MATATLVSVDDYIDTYIRRGIKPACEYVDGFLVAKGMGNRKHSRLQRRLLELLGAYLEFEAFPELHARLRESEFRIPDTAVERKPVADEPYPTRRVYLCIEIISPSDTLGQMLEKCEHYHAWGTLYCWVLDPERQTGWEYHRKSRNRAIWQTIFWRRARFNLALGRFSARDRKREGSSRNKLTGRKDVC
jgi:Uma2 family endonuclease